MKHKIKLKRGYAVEVEDDDLRITDEIVILGNYSKSNFIQTSIVGGGELLLQLLKIMDK